MPSMLLFPRDVLQPNRADDHFAAEANAARILGINVQLVDHDALTRGDVAHGLRGIDATEVLALYRGWMLTPAAYGSTATALKSLGIDLVTTPTQYRHAHQLPNWFPQLSSLTPESTWTTSDDMTQFLEALTGLGSGAVVIKDYSKSEKQYWDEAMFIPDITNSDHAQAVVIRFRELRGDAFDVGYVIRRFERLTTPEARTWWRDGLCVAISSHPDTPNTMPDNLNLAAFEQPIYELGLPFVSVDVARHAITGETRIVEIGDGQVSDRPQTLDAAAFIAAIACPLDQQPAN